jgi:hypothetical protein
MAVRPVQIVRRLDGQPIRRGQRVCGLPLHNIFSANGHCLRRLVDWRDFPVRCGINRNPGASRLAHPPHPAQHRTRGPRQLWRTGALRGPFEPCGSPSRAVASRETVRLSWSLPAERWCLYRLSTSAASTRVNMRVPLRRNSRKHWAFKFWSPGKNGYCEHSRK